MSKPDAQVARSLFAQPGHVISVHDGSRWRWDGDQWEPLQAGHTILDPDRATWRLWTGKALLSAELGVGAIVRVTWCRDGVQWVRQMCGVADLEHGAETQLLVEPWPEGVGLAVVPAYAVELIAPAASGENTSPALGT